MQDFLQTHKFNDRCQSIMLTSADSVPTESTFVLLWRPIFSLNPLLWCQHWEAHSHLPPPWTSVSITISYGVFYLCSSEDSWIFIKKPFGIQWALCTAQKQGSESRCKALNWAKYPGVLSNEWNREEKRASWIPHLGSPWDNVSTVDKRRREKWVCNTEATPLP